MLRYLAVGLFLLWFASPAQAFPAAWPEPDTLYAIQGEAVSFPSTSPFTLADVAIPERNPPTAAVATYFRPQAATAGTARPGRDHAARIRGRAAGARDDLCATVRVHGHRRAGRRRVRGAARARHQLHRPAAQHHRSDDDGGCLCGTGVAGGPAGDRCGPHRAASAFPMAAWCRSMRRMSRWRGPSPGPACASRATRRSMRRASPSSRTGRRPASRC